MYCFIGLARHCLYRQFTQQRKNRLFRVHPGVHAVANTPAQQLGDRIAHLPRCIKLPRYGCRIGLCNVLFKACSAFTHVTACTLALSPNFATRFTGGFNHFVASTVAPVASGWSGCRVGLSTGKTPPFHGARHKRTYSTKENSDLRDCMKASFQLSVLKSTAYKSGFFVYAY